MQQENRNPETRSNRAAAWIYGAIFMTCIAVASLVEDGSFACVLLDGLLVAGFLIVGHQVGLWTLVAKKEAVPIRPRPCPEPPCHDLAS